MAKRKTYDDQYRASAVVMLEAAGYPNTPGALTRVAKHLGIHARTLSRWFNGEQNPPPDQTVTEKKESFIEQLQAIRGLAAQHIKERIEDFEPRDLTGLLKISTELAELLDGKPTERIETVQTWLDGLPADEYEDVIAEAERIIHAGGGADS